MESNQKGKGNASNDNSVDNDHHGQNSLMERHLRSLSQTLNENELVDLLVKLGMTFPQAAEDIRNSARLYIADHHRLSVYSLPEKTTSKTLCDAFSSYGEIAEGHVMTDSATGKSRRFGFITFKKIESVQKALKKKGTLVDGKLSFHQPASEILDGAVYTADVELRRLFVGDLSPDITTEMLLGFFSKYGEIEEGSVIYDEETGKSKEYGFVTFKMFDDAMKAINDPDKILGKNNLIVKTAYYKFKPKNL